MASNFRLVRRMALHELLLLLLLPVLLLLSQQVNAFQGTLSRGSIIAARTFRPNNIISIVRATREEETTTTTSKKTKVVEESLSDMDARVLQSMLQDSQKLDLETEESMKKLLERGVVSKEVPEAPKGSDSTSSNSDSEFSSAALKTLSDTKLWQGISRKAGDWLESAKLLITNKIERDAMTLAALGVFAWERAVRDVARALPAASNATSTTRTNRKSPFLLSQQSTYQQKMDSMATPMDELKSVTSAVADILKTGGSERSTNPQQQRQQRKQQQFQTSSRLRTAATSRSDKRNFQRSYEQTKARESKTSGLGVGQTVASGVVDTAWQMKREFQAEENKAGYKSQQARTALGAATENTKQLLAGAQERTQRLFLKDSSRSSSVQDNGAVVVDATREDVLDVTSSPASSGSGSLNQEEQRQFEAKQRQEKLRQEQSFQQELLQQQQRHQQAQERKERQEQLQEQQQQNEQLQQEQLLIMETELRSECIRMKDQLQNCIVNPEETWLRSDIIEGVQDFDQTLIRLVVTEMIATRNGLKDVLKEIKDVEDKGFNIQHILTELVSVTGKINEMEEHAINAVSLGAAQALRQELVEKSCPTSSSQAGSDEECVENSSLIPVLLRLEEMQQQLEQVVALDTLLAAELEEIENYVEEVETPKEKSSSWQESISSFFASPTSSEMEVEAEDIKGAYALDAEDDIFAEEKDKMTSAAVEAEFVDVVPEAFVDVVASAPVTNGGESESTSTVVPEQDGQQQAVYASSVVELISDDDFEAAVGETKQAVAVSAEAYAEETAVAEGSGEKESNIVFDLLLRSIDVLFFLLEKTFTVSKNV